MGELQEDFGRTWEDLAGLRQEVGWIRQSRADFGRKIADSRGDLVACPDGKVALGGRLGCGWEDAERRLGKMLGRRRSLDGAAGRGLGEAWEELGRS